jgi:hypothetical protein
MTWRLDITRGRPEEATGLKQMPIRARTHKTGAGGMSASLIGHSGRLQTIHHYSMPRFKLSGGGPFGPDPPRR